MFRRSTILLSLSLCLSCGGRDSGGKMPLMTIPTTRVEELSFADKINFTSVIAAKRSYTIQPRVSGFLSAINYSNGMPVSSGSTIYLIDRAPFEAALLETKASLASAEATLREAESNYYRSVPLVNAGAISKSQFDSATATLASARESVNAAKAQLKIANLNLSYTNITAPGDGIIAVSDAQIGDYVGTGTTYEVLTTISQIDSVMVDIPIPTTTYQRYRKTGRPSFENDSLLTEVTLRVMDREYPYKGVYQYTRQNIDQTSGTIILSFDFANPEFSLKPGQYANIEANIGDVYPHLMVPASAVSQVQGSYFLYVVGADSTVTFKKVDVGQLRDDMWEIRDGVSCGEMVAVSGFHKLHNGMKISPQTSNQKEQK